MPRAKEFDPDTVLHRAMELFWEKGYEATSIKNLVDHMGINRFSLYSTFGDKHQLFLSACDRYHETMADNGLRELEDSEDGLEALRRYFWQLVDRYTSEEGARGCFMTNNTCELTAHDESVAEKTGNYLLRVQTAFYRALGRAHQRGEVYNQHRLNDYARYLTSSAQGLAVLAKVKPNRDVFEAVVNVTLDSLK